MRLSYRGWVTQLFLSAPIGELLQVTLKFFVFVRAVRVRCGPFGGYHFLEPLIVQSQYWRLSYSSTLSLTLKTLRLSPTPYHPKPILAIFI